MKVKIICIGGWSLEDAMEVCDSIIAQLPEATFDDPEDNEDTIYVVEGKMPVIGEPPDWLSIELLAKVLPQGRVIVHSCCPVYQNIVRDDLDGEVAHSYPEIAQIARKMSARSF